MSIFETLYSSGIIKALGWTLLHSLWQGLLIIMIASLVLIALRKHAATYRYAVLCGSMLTLLLAAVVTFFTVYQTVKPVSIQESSVRVVSAVATVAQGGVSESGFFNKLIFTYINNVNGFIEHNSHYLVLAWFAGFISFMLRYAGGLYYIGQLKHRGISHIGKSWQRKAEDISEELGIRRSVKVLESVLVHVPVTLGYLKPVILFPLGMMGSMPPEQLEAILVHEMAHILRKDYLVNLLQSLMEALFFFNPAVWWISQRIRTEREHICDDIAVKFSSDPITYIKALTTMEEMTSKTPVMANAFTGNKKRLLNRVRRMVQPVGTKVRATDSLATVLIMLTMVLLLGAGTNLNKLMAGTFVELGSPAISPDALNTLMVDKPYVGNPSGTAILNNFSAGQASTPTYPSEILASEPDTTKALTEEEKASLEEQKAAKEEALEGVREAMQQKDEAMRVYHEAMKNYQDVMHDFHIERDGDVKWVMKVDSLDSAGVIVMPHMPKNYMFFSDGDLKELKELEGLDSLKLLEFEFPEPGHFKYSYSYPGPDNYHFYGDNGEHDIFIKHGNEILEWNGNDDEDMRRMEIEIRQHQKEMKEDQFQWQEQQKDWQKQQHEWQDQQKRIEREIIVKPDIRVNPEPYSSYFFEREKSPEHYIRQELIEDRLISRGNDYIVELNSNSMYINGAKQPRDIFKKYKKLYESASGEELDVPVKMVF